MRSSLLAFLLISTTHVSLYASSYAYPNRANTSSSYISDRYDNSRNSDNIQRLSPLEERIESFYRHELQPREMQELFNQLDQQRPSLNKYNASRVKEDLKNAIALYKSQQTLDDRIKEYLDGFLQNWEEKKSLLDDMYKQRRFGDVMNRLEEELYRERGREKLEDLERGFEGDNLSTYEENLLFSKLNERIQQGRSITRGQEAILDKLKNRQGALDESANTLNNDVLNRQALQILEDIIALLPQKDQPVYKRTEVMKSLRDIAGSSNNTSRNTRAQPSSPERQKVLKTLLSAIERSEKSYFPMDYVIHALMSVDGQKKYQNGYRLSSGKDYLKMLASLRMKESDLKNKGFEIDPFKLTRDESLLIFTNLDEAQNVCTSYERCINEKETFLKNLQRNNNDAVFSAAVGDVLSNYIKLAEEEFPYSVIFSLEKLLDAKGLDSFKAMLKKRDLSIEKLTSMDLSQWKLMDRTQVTNPSDDMIKRMDSADQLLDERVKMEWKKLSDIGHKKNTVKDNIKTQSDDFKDTAKEKGKEITKKTGEELKKAQDKVTKNIEDKISKGVEGFLDNILGPSKK
jgi:hypothetical protein